MRLLREWLARRRAARAAAHERKLADLRARFPGEPEHLIRAIAAGGTIAVCAIRAIQAANRQQEKEERLRQIIREELDRHAAAPMSVLE